MADANNEMLLKYYHRGVLQRNLKLILLRLALRAEKDLQAYLKEKGFRFPDLIHFLTLYATYTSSSFAF